MLSEHARHYIIISSLRPRSAPSVNYCSSFPGSQSSPSPAASRPPQRPPSLPLSPSPSPSSVMLNT
ncbi:hypothetical protein ASPTUDRAFT_39026 [Aspergillus tubingensis CBS 134.48]|uniref:Uncharacterized protein n=1 Tax=Aspergillus tubingensis (strain CBS 134.48) TaxID=767770 RepID=A0A1L9NAG1_ASPTC|nr:hypothetical protein ASPTUDRAFT_39026 [Aspergillus tubingensis CBS 134.48]